MRIYLNFTNKQKKVNRAKYGGTGKQIHGDKCYFVK